ncbi:hypothetical protein JOY44_01240 [Phormidium sp. CLA17]|uniref:hypothetical protein n=1 Tax=Leptolyngbya sp. Cla-17 TaxID=2803751 RepID=UPI001490EF42|nr:hypothetical protein [Leptolyngbya sp. Cla-17]MBM0740279.1 hypothetical protein [Leptolyngbya sp. Cla-17]
MNNDRLRQIEENLNLLREQQASLEREALLTTGLPKTQAEQRLRLEIKPKIRDYEQEYWQILAENINQLAILEPEAEVAIAEIVKSVAQIEVQQTDACSAEVLQILREIRDKLNQLGTTAAAKLKGVISSIPPFIGVSYEAELDTENFFRKHFPTFTRVIKGAAKK